jgi:hypothetical protein
VRDRVARQKPHQSPWRRFRPPVLSTAREQDQSEAGLDNRPGVRGGNVGRDTHDPSSKPRTRAHGQSA